MRRKPHPNQLPLPGTAEPGAGAGKATEWPVKPATFPQVGPQVIPRLSPGEEPAPPEETDNLSTSSTGPTTIDQV